MDQFILRIMDIVNGYDSNIMKEQANEWYWEFYQRFAENSDFFVLNYDTTIEKAIDIYEDGFEPDELKVHSNGSIPRSCLKIRMAYLQ